MKTHYLSIALSVALSGCSLIPDYQRPPAPIQAGWPQGEAYAKLKAGTHRPSQTRDAELNWQVFFRDPVMRELIATALNNNRDLRQTALNVEAYRALHRIERSALLPRANTGVGATRQRLPADLSPQVRPVSRVSTIRR